MQKILLTAILAAVAGSAGGAGPGAPLPCGLAGAAAAGVGALVTSISSTSKTNAAPGLIFGRSITGTSGGRMLETLMRLMLPMPAARSALSNALRVVPPSA